METLPRKICPMAEGGRPPYGWIVSDIREIRTAGARLAVHVRGTGAPLLFVHGFPLDHEMWSHQLAHLDEWRCIAPDLRGAGASEAPRDGYTMGDYAADLAGVCDALGVTAAVCCGFSMGGYVLFELFRHRPELFRALILCDTRSEPDTADGRRGRDEQAALVEREGAAALTDVLVPKLLGATTRSRNPEVVETVRMMGRRQPVRGVVGALGAMRDRSDATPLLPRIAVPTLVVCGVEDQVTPPAGALAMAQRMPQARYVEIEWAGHLAPLEQPDRVTRAVREFLAGL
jgi:pimeloyl-ACP methyl ester carboxylesterase